MECGGTKSMINNGEIDLIQVIGAMKVQEIRLTLIIQDLNSELGRLRSELAMLREEKSKAYA